jgi:hypothetical protein
LTVWGSSPRFLLTKDKGNVKMDNKDWPKVWEEAVLQGWRIRETQDGYMLLAPDGVGKVTMDRLHKSSSPYALNHTVRQMRRFGFTWPPPRR